MNNLKTHFRPCLLIRLAFHFDGFHSTRCGGWAGNKLHAKAPSDGIPGALIER